MRPMVSGTSLSKVQLSDTELHYIEKGIGDPVILVHGASETADNGVICKMSFRTDSG